jgi:hypothetical protein
MAIPDTPATFNPTAAGSFGAWCGINWNHGTGPGVGGYSANNVIRNADGSVTFRMTVAGGVATGCEIDSVSNTFGYGTYYIVTRTPLINASAAMVWGALFTYQGGHPEQELDIQEATGSPFTVTTHHWATSGASINPGGNSFVVPNGPMCSKVIWSAGNLQFKTWAGTDESGTLIGNYTTTDRVPVPINPFLCLNLWTGSNAINPIDITVEKVAYIPQGTTPVTTNPKVSTYIDSYADMSQVTQVSGTAGAATVSGGKLLIPTQQPYTIVQNPLTYDATSSSVFFQISEVPLTGAGTTEATMWLYNDDDNQIRLTISGGTLLCRVRKATVNTDNSIAFSSTWKFLKVTESAGNIIFARSVDGVTYTTLFTVAHGMTSIMQNVRVRFESGYYGAETPPVGRFGIEGVNVSTTGTGSTTPPAIASSHLTIVPNPNYPGMMDNFVYDLTSSNVYAEISTFPSVGNGSIEGKFRLDFDANNHVDFVFAQRNGVTSVNCQKTVAGTATDTWFTRNLSHPFYRFVESAGTITYQSSTSPTAGWTTIFSQTHGMGALISDTQVAFLAGHTLTEGTPGTFVIEGVNIASGVTPPSTATYNRVFTIL